MRPNIWLVVKQYKRLKIVYPINERYTNSATGIYANNPEEIDFFLSFSRSKKTKNKADLASIHLPSSLRQKKLPPAKSNIFYARFAYAPA